MTVAVVEATPVVTDATDADTAVAAAHARWAA